MENQEGYKSKWEEGLHLSNGYVRILEETTHYYEGIVSSLTTAETIMIASIETMLGQTEFNYSEYEPTIKIDLSNLKTEVSEVKDKITEYKNLVNDDYYTYALRVDTLIQKIEEVIRESNPEFITNGEVNWEEFWANSKVQEEIMKKIMNRDNFDINAVLEYLDTETLNRIKLELTEAGFTSEDIDAYYKEGGLGFVLTSIAASLISNAKGELFKKLTKAGATFAAKGVANAADKYLGINVTQLLQSNDLQRLIGQTSFGDILKSAITTNAITLAIDSATNIIIDFSDNFKVDNIGEDVVDAGLGLVTSLAFEQACIAVVGVSPPAALTLVVTTALGWVIKQGAKETWYGLTHVDGVPTKFEKFNSDKFIEDTFSATPTMYINGEKCTTDTAIPALQAMGYTEKEAIYEMYYQSQDPRLLEYVYNEDGSLNIEYEAYELYRNNQQDMIGIRLIENRQDMENVENYNFPELIETEKAMIETYMRNAENRYYSPNYDFYENCQNGDVVGERTVYVADSVETFSNVASTHPNDECVIVIPKGTEVQWDEGFATFGHSFDTSEGNVYLCWDPNATDSGGAYRQINSSGGFIGDSSYSVEGFNKKAGIFTSA